MKFYDAEQETSALGECVNADNIHASAAPGGIATGVTWPTLFGFDGSMQSGEQMRIEARLN